jgi:hypothetical protein
MAVRLSALRTIRPLLPRTIKGGRHNKNISKLKNKAIYQTTQRNIRIDGNKHWLREIIYFSYGMHGFITISLKVRHFIPSLATWISVHTITTCFSKIHFNIIIPITHNSFPVSLSGTRVLFTLSIRCFQRRTFNTYNASLHLKWRHQKFTGIVMTADQSVTETCTVPLLTPTVPRNHFWQ